MLTRLLGYLSTIPDASRRKPEPALAAKRSSCGRTLGVAAWCEDWRPAFDWLPPSLSFMSRFASLKRKRR
jgi:hypothetical protein